MKRLAFLTTGMALFPLSLFHFLSKGGRRENGGFKVNAGEARLGRKFKMKGVTLNMLDLKIASQDTNGDYVLFEQNGLTPNGGPPLHIHPYQDEFFYIISGEYLFQVGDEKFQLKAGDTIFLPRNIPHAFLQKTQTGKVLVSYIPAGKMEEFFRATDSWVTPPSNEEIVKVFEAHEMKIVGPPLQI